MLKTIFPWFLSAGTLAGMWLTGNKNKWGWGVGLANQALWITFILLYSAWGLLPLALALIVVYSRNLYRWHNERVQLPERPLAFQDSPFDPETGLLRPGADLGEGVTVVSDEIIDDRGRPILKGGRTPSYGNRPEDDWHPGPPQGKFG